MLTLKHFGGEVMQRYIKWLIALAIGFAFWSYWHTPNSGIQNSAHYQVVNGVHQFAVWPARDAAIAQRG